MRSQPCRRIWCPTRICSIHPSAEGPGHLFNSGSENRNGNCTLEDSIGLPSLPDLLNGLEQDVDLDSLEELTQSLLQDIAADLEAAAQKTNCEEPIFGGEERGRAVVGPPSEELESSRCVSVKSEPAIEDEISPYLLLHHNYSAKQPPQPAPKKVKNVKKLNTKTKPKLIMPKIEPVDNSDILYGTLDESTNCITIIVGDSSLRLSEAVTEVVTTVNNDLHVHEDSVEMLDVKSQASPYNSDCGYESLDSPHSMEEPDIWDQSVSELFPTLL
uniref:Uncharacterized protein n=1 Tax=Photinus pyralis TaxID=7054 RepID=A0A1Y1M674_PHOPY